MVEAYVDRPVWSVIPGSTSSAGDTTAAVGAGHLRLVPPPGEVARSVASDLDTGDPFERAGLRVGRAIGRLGLRRSMPAESVPPRAAAPAPRGWEATTRQGNVVVLRSAPPPAPTAPAGVDWSRVKHLLDVVDLLPPLRAMAEALLGPWGLDLLVVAGAAVGLLYPGNPLGIAAGHGELLDLAVPLVKVALGAVLSPLAVEVALALLGIGRLLWSRRAAAPRPALGV